MKVQPQADLSKGLAATLTLNNNVKIPIVGLGTYGLEAEETTAQTVAQALQLGYRHLDTASIYNNEVGVGKGIAQSGIPREAIFITTKVWNTEQGYSGTLAAFEKSLNRLNIDFVDLYLIHWPKPEHTKDTWRAMEELYHAKKIRALGVSNFTEKHLAGLLEADAAIIPTVNQVEQHPQFPQLELKNFCEKHNIYLAGWAPLIRGKVFEMDVLKTIATRYKKTPAQIALRWQIQQNIITIPKTSNLQRLKENSDLFDFTLTSEDFENITSLRGNRVWQHPDEIDF
ncbi:glyoxal reductase [Spirochaetota bacterium]|nr:glyoxal reductase [Spirochaetota bacterium]